MAILVLDPALVNKLNGLQVAGSCRSRGVVLPFAYELATGMGSSEVGFGCLSRRFRRAIWQVSRPVFHETTPKPNRC